MITGKQTANRSENTSFYTMNKKHGLLLQLLRVSLWGEIPSALPIGSVADWEMLLDFARQHSVQGLVANGILSLAQRCDAGVPGQIVRQCLNCKFATIHNNVRVNQVLSKVLLLLKSYHLAPIVLKGQGVARYYPEANFRVPGDIDIYLGKDSERGAAVLLPLADNGVNYGHSKHICLEIDGVEIELHRLAVDKVSTCQSRVMTEWSESKLRQLANRQADSLPDPLFDIVFGFYHLWYHFLYTGVGLRQFCDWAMVLHRHHASVSATELETLLRKMGLLREWQLLGLFLTDRLGLPQEQFPLYSNRHRMAARLMATHIMELGNFGIAISAAREQAYRSHPRIRRLIHFSYAVRTRFYKFLLSPKVVSRRFLLGHLPFSHFR